MLSSLALADIVADAIGIKRPTAQLQLRTIRAVGLITFKGFGRSAAAMEPIDAARLLIAVAGSTFAKDGVQVLGRFAKLATASRPETFEEVMASDIAALADGSQPSETVGFELVWGMGESRSSVKHAYARSWLAADGKPVLFSKKGHAKSGAPADVLREVSLLQTRMISHSAVVQIAKALR
ncbi:hypothetical protein ACVIGB_000529 [Bradyrhizobium sp. USDA 4341]